MSLRFECEDPRVETINQHVKEKSICHYGKAEIEKDTLEYTLAPSLGLVPDPIFSEKIKNFMQLGAGRGTSLVVILDKVQTPQEQEESFKQNLIEILCSLTEPQIKDISGYVYVRRYYENHLNDQLDKTGTIGANFRMPLDKGNVYAIAFSNLYPESFPRYSPEPMILLNRTKIFNDVGSKGRKAIRTKFRVSVFQGLGRKPSKFELAYLDKGDSPLYFLFSQI